MSALDAVTLPTAPTSARSLEGYDPTNRLDFSNVHYRCAAIKYALTAALNDLRWVKSHPTRADYISRVGTGISHLENVLDELDAGEREEQRQKEARTREIVARAGVPPKHRTILPVVRPE
jgi:hypothetical protein